MKRPKRTEFERNFARELRRYCKLHPLESVMSPAMLARARRCVVIVEDTERSFEDEMFFCLNGGRYPDEKF
jgi:hypothetical protein